MPNPSIIQGPAVIVHDGQHLYTEGDISLRLVRQTFNPKTQVGSLGPRLQSQKYTIGFKPFGQLDAGNISKLLPYGRGAETVSTGAAGIPGFPICTKTTVIHSIISNVTYTFAKAGITKMPDITASSTKTLWGDAEITAIGDMSKGQEDADFYTSLGSSAAWGTGLDGDSAVTQPWSLAVGARSSPFNAIGSVDGFVLSPKMTVKEIMDENVGIASIVLEDVAPELTFAPNNLTAAELNQLLHIVTPDGSDSNLGIGQAIGRGLGTSGSFTAENYVVSATDVKGRTWLLTLYAAGLSDAEGAFGVGTHQHKKVTAHGTRRFSSGVGQALFNLEQD
jgi:hypothetical protein